MPGCVRVRRGWHSINYRDPVAGFVCAIFPTSDRVQLVFESASDVDDDVVGRYLDLAVEVGAARRAR